VAEVTAVERLWLLLLRGGSCGTRVLNGRGLRPLRFRIRIRLCTQIRIMSGSIELPIANTMTSQHKSGVTASDSALAEMRGGARQQHSRSDGPNRVVHRQYDLPPNFGHRRASARGCFPPSPPDSVSISIYFILHPTPAAATDDFEIPPTIPFSDCNVYNSYLHNKAKVFE
jgi:hypothetical protein